MHFPERLFGQLVHRTTSSQPDLSDQSRYIQYNNSSMLTREARVFATAHLLLLLLLGGLLVAVGSSLVGGKAYLLPHIYIIISQILFNPHLKARGSAIQRHFTPIMAEWLEPGC